jgi:hypothetical protein
MLMNIPVTFDFEPYGGLSPLTIEGLRTHVYDPQSEYEFLLVEESSQIPENIPVPLREILLGRIGKASLDGVQVDIYKLPDDYLTLASVLNDATSSVSSRASELAKGVFAEIGHSLSKIHRYSKLVPASLSYEDIIIERDVDNFLILPPVEFIEVRNELAVAEIGKILLEELSDNAGNLQRKEMVTQAFEGFWESINEGR